MIVETSSWEEILPVWQSDLWLNRTSLIKPTSSMKFLGGYDMTYHNNLPTFWKLVNEDKTIIGCISGHLTTSQSYRIRGLWVKSNYRGFNYSSMLFATAEQFAISIGCNTIWSYPRHKALPVYINNGYKVESSPIEDPTEIHGPYYFVMKQL